MDRRVTMAFARFDAAELQVLPLPESLEPLVGGPAAVSRRELARRRLDLVRRDSRAAARLRLRRACKRPCIVAATGALGVLFYKLIKNHAVRERPYITHSAIECASAPLDRYSFPSGHTLHAVCFTVMLATYLPEWAAALVALATLIALSRVILGLHYPTDVAAGAVLGGLLGFGSVMLGPQWFV